LTRNRLEPTGPETGNALIAVLVDSHAHLELEPLVLDPAGVVHRASQAGVAAIITVGIDLEDARRALAIADKFPNVFACLGFHPHHAKDADDDGFVAMEKLAAHPKVKGYGEIGLDFFRNHSPHDRQRAVFAEQIALAKRLGTPVVIHLRDAYPEGLAMLEKAAPFQAGGVIHCFSGNAAEAARALEMGFFLSIPGTVTYKKNDKLRDIVRTIPSDRLLVETDCPFLAPEPLRGKDNEPAFIVHTVRKVAEVRGESVERIAHITTANAVRLFGLPTIGLTVP
jgi:TatD DNase family protein